MQGRLNGKEPGAGRLLKKLLQMSWGETLKLELQGLQLELQECKTSQNKEIFRTQRVTDYWGQKQREESRMTPEF